MESSGREQNYWPGFVDALSNVVLTLVFVLVVFVFALVIASNKVEQKAVQMVQEAHKKAAQGQSAEVIDKLETQLDQANAEISDLKEQIKTSSLEKSVTIAVDDKNGLKVEGAVTISTKDNRIVITFPAAVSDLDAPSLAELDKVLQDIKKKSVADIHIFSYIGKESYSAAKRLAYYRVLGLRNHMLKNPSFKDAKISNQIVSPKEVTDGRVEIVFD